MNELLYMTVIILASAAAGILAGCGSIFVINHVPAAWLCDYGEEPSEKVISEGRQRVPGMPWKYALSAVFIVICIYMGMKDWQYGACGAAYCWVLSLIGTADAKYMIIPDQFVLLLALTAVGFIPFSSGPLEMVMGLAAGGGVMLLIWAVSRLIYGKDAMGFGDVKLCAAAGLAIGWKGSLFMIAAGSFACGIYAAARLVARKSKAKDHVPLGPFLCGGAAVYVVIIHFLLQSKGFGQL